MTKVTIEDLFDLKSVSQPIVSENNYFYLETKVDVKKNSYHSSVYSIDPVTAQKKHWGDQGSKNQQISLSPNGKYLSFLSNNTTDQQVQVMIIPVAGGAHQQITFEKKGVTSFIWASNSSRIYYQTSTGLKGAESQPKEDVLPEPTVIEKLNYKMDGAGIIDGNARHQIKAVGIYDQAESLIIDQKEAVHLSYVAKDESFLIIADELDPSDEWSYGSTVYYYDVKSQERYSLTADIPTGSFNFSEMNQEESQLLLVGNDFKYGFVTQQKLYCYELATKKLSCLTAELDLEVGDSIIGDFQQNVRGISPVWLTGEDYLFPTTEHGCLKLYKGNLEGGNQLFFEDALHVTDLAVDQLNQRLLISYSQPTLPSALGVIDLRTGKLKQLFNPNSSFSQTKSFTESEMFWYKGVDNWDIQGWYLPPAEEKVTHPAILYIHGGPQVCYGESFFHEMQVHSANGYGVILLNPRGGMGYGQDFVKAIIGDYGNQDYQDLMLGVDHVLATHAEIDSSSVYVAGGSYGGFMTNWIVGHTNRFKRGVTQRSISNWLSFYGTSDIGPFFVKYQLERSLAEASELWQLSPLAYVSQAKTPLLVLHGQEDLRCPLEQGEQMYIAMKEQGVETKMITFPQSSHGLSRMGLPNLRKERLKNIVEWFETK